MARVVDNRMNWFKKEARRLLGTKDAEILAREAEHQQQCRLLGVDKWKVTYNIRKIAKNE